MFGLDLALLCSKAQGLRADSEHGGGPRQVHPPLGLGHLRTIDRDFVVAAKRRHPFAGPAIAVSSTKIITVKQSCDHVIAADARQQPYRLHDFRSTVARLSSPASSYAKFGVNTAHPVHNKNYLSTLRVEVSDHFVNELARNALLQPNVSARITPDRFQIIRQGCELLGARRCFRRRLADMLFDSALQLPDAFESTIPA